MAPSGIRHQVVRIGRKVHVAFDVDCAVVKVVDKIWIIWLNSENAIGKLIREPECSWQQRDEIERLNECFLN